MPALSSPFSPLFPSIWRAMGAGAPVSTGDAPEMAGEPGLLVVGRTASGFVAGVRASVQRSMEMGVTQLNGTYVPETQLMGNQLVDGRLGSFSQMKESGIPRESNDSVLSPNQTAQDIAKAMRWAELETETEILKAELAMLKMKLKDKDHERLPRQDSSIHWKENKGRQTSKTPCRPGSKTQRRGREPRRVSRARGSLKRSRGYNSNTSPPMRTQEQEQNSISDPSREPTPQKTNNPVTTSPENNPLPRNQPPMQLL